MNKTELVAEIAAKTGFTKKDTGAVVETILNVITDTLVSGDEVGITGFGKFSVVDKPARVSRNPKTGEEVKVPAKKAPKFKASTNLKSAIN